MHLEMIMPTHSQNLKNLLFPALTKSADLSNLEVQTSASGPAELIRWNLVEGEDAFVVPAPVVESDQRQIVIFARAIRDFAPATSIEIALLSLLIESPEFDVFIYPGEGIKFTSLQPCTSINRFFDPDVLSESATAEEVKIDLARQGRNTQNICVLDKNLLQNLEYHTRTINPNYYQDVGSGSPQLDKVEMLEVNFSVCCDLHSNNEIDLTGSPQLWFLETANDHSDEFKIKLAPQTRLKFLGLNRTSAKNFPLINTQTDLLGLSYNCYESDIENLQIDLGQHHQLLTIKLCLSAPQTEIHLPEISCVRNLVMYNHNPILLSGLSEQQNLRELKVEQLDVSPLHLNLTGLTQLRNVRIHCQGELHLTLDGPLPQHLETIQVNALHIHTSSQLNFPAKVRVSWHDRTRQSLANQYANSGTAVFSMAEPVTLTTGNPNLLYTYRKARGECEINIPDYREDKFRTRLITDAHLTDDNLLVLSSDPDARNLINIPINFNAIYEPETAWSADLKNHGFRAKLQTGILYPLTILDAQIDIPIEGENIFISVHPKNAVSIFWDRITHQMYCKLNAGLPNQTQVEIAYQRRRNNSYYSYSSYTTKLNHSEDLLLEDRLQDALIDTCEKIASFQELFSSELTWEQKLNAIVDYCESFERNVLPAELPPNSLEALLYSIREHVGTHEHIIQAIFYLAQMIGIPALIRKGAHTVALEIAMIKDGKMQWSCVNIFNKTRVSFLPPDEKILSTKEYAATHFSLAPEDRPAPATSSTSATPGISASALPASASFSEHAPKSKPQPNSGSNFFNRFAGAFISTFHTNPPATIARNVSESVQAQQERARIKRRMQQREAQLHYQKYIELFTTLTASQMLSSPTALMTQRYAFSPLLQVAEKDLDKAEKLIFNASAANTSIVQVHNVAELNKYLAPFVIANGRRQQVAGPLAAIRDQGGVLVQYWDGFTRTQQITFKSVADQEPTLAGKHLSTATHVIGVKTEDLSVADAFLSRMQLFEPGAVFFNVNSETQSAAASSAVRMITIDLDFDPNWRSIIFGTPLYQGHTINIIPPKPENDFLQLLTATDNVEITFINFLKGDFEKFYRQIEIENRFMHQDRFFAIGKNISVKKKIIPLEKINGSEIQIKKTTSYNVPENFTLLHLYNWHECFNQDVVDVNEQAMWTRAGFLQSHTKFFVVGQIPEHLWRRFVNHYTAMQLSDVEIFLAPGASIAGVVNADLPTVELVSNPENSARIFLTNDGDYLAEELATINAALIIDVNPQKQPNQLFYQTSYREDPENPGRQLFSLEKHPALIQLENGGDLVLNLQNESLLQQLPGLLLTPPRLPINGEWFYPKGQLEFVLPLHAENKLPAVQILKTIFSDEDYRQMFADRATDIENILKFMAYARLYPHRGIGMPEIPTLSHARIKNFLYALSPEYKRHPHNPLKGFFS